MQDGGAAGAGAVVLPAGVPRDTAEAGLLCAGTGKHRLPNSRRWLQADAAISG